ncbi:hypothetical protein C8R44DRAFT_873982 [Mycena epipterygia]|nr:hypothetical protein C8R44DRAFT_873982 [Mycena epipterygia]
MSGFLCVVTVPFNGILVRYRASYHPKLSVEDGSVPPPPTFISMAKRVWRLEGVAGLSRGLMPTIMAAFAWPFWWSFQTYLSPSASNTRSLFSSFFCTLIYTIIIVTVYRCIVTPRKLDPLNAREALHIIFSAHERKRPWAIYQIPGLLPALFANLAFNKFIVQPLRDFVLPWQAQQRFPPLEYGVRYALFIVVLLLATGVITPIEVIVTRLALQRNYGGPTFVDGSATVNGVESALTAEEIVAAQSAPAVATPPTLIPVESTPEAQIPVQADVVAPSSEKTSDYPVEKPDVPAVTTQPVQTVAEPIVTSGTDIERGPLTVDSDDVVVQYVRRCTLLATLTNAICSLCSENTPYLGLVDCGKRIIAEEGWPVLYRMWFVSFLGIFV